jgi:hypothetical protein
VARLREVRYALSDLYREYMWSVKWERASVAEGAPPLRRAHSALACKQMRLDELRRGSGLLSGDAGAAAAAAAAALQAEVAHGRAALRVAAAAYAPRLRYHRDRRAAAAAALFAAEEELDWLSAHLRARSRGAAWLAASHLPLPRLIWRAIALAAGEPLLDFRRAKHDAHTLTWLAWALVAANWCWLPAALDA